MPNIIITNRCNRSCNYCFAQNKLVKKSECIQKDEMSITDFKKVLLFLKKSGESDVRLMGGEPTLHRDFEKIVKLIMDKNLTIHVFTNGLFSKNIADFLFAQGKNIKYSFNIDFQDTYKANDWLVLNRNLKKISTLENYLVGGVIWKTNYNIDHLIALTKKYGASKVIMLRSANPTLRGNNIYIKDWQLKAMAKNLVKEVDKANKNKIKIGFGCGLAKNMFDKNDFNLLKKYDVANMNWGCSGNSGKFDINPDLSVTRCFPLYHWLKKDLFSFKSSQEIKHFFNQSARDYVLAVNKSEVFTNGFCLARIIKKD